MSVCEKEKDKVTNGRSCDAIDCCKTIPSDLDAFSTKILTTDGAPFASSKDCKYAFFFFFYYNKEDRIDMEKANQSQ